jgi:hypothetical protein
MASGQNPTLHVEPLTQVELISALNELLEAERAGARVTLETAQQLDKADLKELVSDIQHDEVRWCKMLLTIIRTFQMTPSMETGSFYEKAIAISDIPERLLFINRGQGWVVRRLEGLIPRVTDVHIQSKLQAMLDAHQVNIDRVNERFQSPN